MNRQAEPAGMMPYEMTGRSEPRPPLVSFDDPSGWSATAEGCQGRCERSAAQHLWYPHTTRVGYQGGPGGVVTLRPSAPLAVHADCDCLEMWIYGNRWEFAPPPDVPPVVISALITDEAGAESELPLTTIRWEEWWLVHRRLPAQMRPAALSGLIIRGVDCRQERSIWLGPLYLFREPMEPLSFETQPSPNLIFPEGQRMGVHRGASRLPFPTRPDTIAPICSDPVRTRVWRISARTYGLEASGRLGTVRYEYTPRTGGLSEVRCTWNGRPACVPMQQGGVEIDGGIPVGATLIDHRLDGARVITRFRISGQWELEYRLGISGRSLTIDVQCRGGHATGLDVGRVAETHVIRLLQPPFLTLGTIDPLILAAETPGGRCFISVFDDWYRSNASQLWCDTGRYPDGARLNGGARYLPRTDGTRNDLYERIVLTVAPTYEEALPFVPNPPASGARDAGTRLWQESWGPADYQREIDRVTRLHSFGIEKMTLCNHEITWRDGGESFTFRTEPAPGKGGAAALQRYVATVKALGWRCGLYTNYTDFAPVNRYWHESMIARNGDKQMITAWPRCYAVKFPRSVEYDARLSREIKRRFDPDSAYTDVHTALMPWAYTDYDARVPGAGAFAPLFYAYGQLLLNDQKVYGAAFSEGSYHWMYAGLATGNYALAYQSRGLHERPLDVAFALHRIHPLECDIGMGWTANYIRTAVTPDADVDRFVAATMAYGHIGWLVEDHYGMERVGRCYYMLQQLQSRYALVRPRRIRYGDGQGGWESASEAACSGLLDESRLHVEYVNGLNLYVNGSNSDWSISLRNHSWVLPPWGWLAFDGRGFLEVSAWRDGHRFDYVLSPEYEYLDGRGIRTTMGALCTEHGVALRRRPKGWLLTLMKPGSWVGVESPDGVWYACAPDGTRIQRQAAERDARGWTWLQAPPDIYRLEFIPQRPTRPASGIRLSVDTEAAPGGLCRVSCTVPSGFGSVQIGVGWGDRPHPSQPVRSGRYTVDIPVPEDASGRLWGTVRLTRSGMRPESLRFCVPIDAPYRLAADLRTDGSLSVDATPRRGIPRPDRLEVTSSDPAVLSVIPAAGAWQCRLAEGALQGRAVISCSARGSRGSAQMSLTVQAERSARVIADLFEPGIMQTAREGVRGQPETMIDPTSGAYVTASTDMKCGGVSQAGIAMHPPYNNGVGYVSQSSGPIQLPKAPCVFRTQVGIRDGGNPSDGVLYRVTVISADGMRHVVAEVLCSERAWQPLEADLSRWSGQSIAVELLADVGPDNNASADWAAWATPRIETREAQSTYRRAP